LELLNQIALHVSKDTLSGDIDGSNTTFETSYAPIADRDFDGTVGTSDVIVTAWVDSDDPFTAYTLSVSKVDADTGQIVLSSAPPSTIDQLTADYYYYPKRIESRLLTVATAYLAAYKYVLAEYLLIPQQFYHGAYRFRLGEPWNKLREEYERVVELLLAKPYAKGEHGDMEEPDQLLETGGTSDYVLGGTLYAGE